MIPPLSSIPFTISALKFRSIEIFCNTCPLFVITTSSQNQTACVGNNVNSELLAPIIAILRAKRLVKCWDELKTTSAMKIHEIHQGYIFKQNMPLYIVGIYTTFPIWRMESEPSKSLKSKDCIRNRVWALGNYSNYTSQGWKLGVQVLLAEPRCSVFRPLACAELYFHGCFLHCFFAQVMQNPCQQNVCLIVVARSTLLRKRKSRASAQPSLQITKSSILTWDRQKSCSKVASWSARNLSKLWV